MRGAMSIITVSGTTPWVDRADHIPSPRCSTEAARRDAQTSLLKELSDATHSPHKVLREIVVRVGTTKAYWSDDVRCMDGYHSCLDQAV